MLLKDTPRTVKALQMLPNRTVGEGRTQAIRKGKNYEFLLGFHLSDIVEIVHEGAGGCIVLSTWQTSDRRGNECRKGREGKDRVRQAIHGNWGGGAQEGAEMFPISSTCFVVRKLISTMDGRMSGLAGTTCCLLRKHGPCCF